MKKAIVTRAFQFKGAMPKSGALLQLAEDDLKSDFVLSHVKLLDENEEPRTPDRNYLGNGEEKKDGAPPAQSVGGKSEGMTADELRKALAEIGVPVPPNAKKADLAALYTQAKEALSGSPAAANKPADDGLGLGT